MRIDTVLLAGALALGIACPVLAQAPAAGAPAQEPAAADGALPGIGEVEFGARVVSGLDEVGRFQRFTDPRGGPALDRLRYTRERETWTFSAAVERAGYRDQRYAASFERFGRLKASFEWNQVPIWFSGVSTSPFAEESPGVFRLDNVTQAAVEAGAATIAGYADTLNVFDTRARRDVADARLVYSAMRNLDLSVSLVSTSRTGEQPWGASFGFSNANELPLTLDHRTNDFSAAAEWSNARGMARIVYDGSWFNNSVESLVWDNPLRFTDRTHPSAYSAGDGSAQGRMALWPDSTAHTVSAAGSVALPARSRAFASVSVGSWLQDERLLPHTINTAVQPIPLPRETAEAEARIVSMTYRLTSRPVRTLWLTAQFRHYDYDNRTPHFEVGQYVRLDGNVATSATGGSEPFEYARRFVDVDASFTPLRFVAFRAGYGHERDDRTFRFLEETTEHVARASIDSTGLAWGSVRLQYDHAERTGEGLDEQVLSDIGEQVSLRQFDISDRTRDRVSAIVQVLPWQAIGVNGSVSVGREERPDAAFGLQQNDLTAVTAGLDVAPRDDVSLGLSYAFETYGTLQRSRQANRGAQFNDPTRDWATDIDEDVHTWTANLDLPRLTDRLGAALFYDYVRSDAQYIYELPPDSTLVAPQQLPTVRNEYHQARVDVRYALTRQFAIAAGYMLDKYSVSDFARSSETLSTPLMPTYVNLLYQWRPYDVHRGSLRLIYRW